MSQHGSSKSKSSAPGVKICSQPFSGGRNKNGEGIRA
jgi:hypothetical protein